jgi:hypothetical protein
MWQPFLEFESLSTIIRDRTPGAVVLTPAESLVPVYYSQRHVIRGINSDAWHTWAIPQARKEFPGAPALLRRPRQRPHETIADAAWP